MTPKPFPKPANPVLGYSVKEASVILCTSLKQTSALFQKFNIPKIDLKYYATKEDLERILNRPNRKIKEYDLYETSTT